MSKAQGKFDFLVQHPFNFNRIQLCHQLHFKIYSNRSYFKL